MTWIEILIASGVVICSLVGVLMVILTLPGIWFMILAAALAQWWSWDQSQPVATDPAGIPTSTLAHAPNLMFSWWVLGIAVALALIGEIVEFFASAVGAAKAGGTRRGAIGSVIGGIVGAILGTAIVPILGTIIGAALGAGVGALLLERHDGRKTWKEATKIGAGAAAGRFVATIAKVSIAAVAAILLSIDAFL